MTGVVQLFVQHIVEAKYKGNTVHRTVQAVVLHVHPFCHVQDNNAVYNLPNGAFVITVPANVDFVTVCVQPSVHGHPCGGARLNAMVQHHFTATTSNYATRLAYKLIKSKTASNRRTKCRQDGTCIDKRVHICTRVTILWYGLTGGWRGKGRRLWLRL